MTFEEYQKKARTTARGHTKKDELFHLLLGLVGETGEIAEKFKKLVRDNDTDETLVNKADLEKELGDVLWYVTILADYFGLSLDDIAEKNVAKLADRKRRNVIKGSGDNR
jgi:NTP pyrophosphatase (non-canonical NTP hydrolase)